MGFPELLMLGIALALDSFSVTISNSCAYPHESRARLMLMPVAFGAFQAGMPVLGYVAGGVAAELIERYSGFVAMAILGVIGANMIRESLSKKEESVDDSFSFKAMIVLALATSIDALAVGISFVTVIPNIPIYAAAPCIGCVTFGLSALGLKIGNLFGLRFKNKAEFDGGVILCLIGVEILLEHLGVFGGLF